MLNKLPLLKRAAGVAVALLGFLSVPHAQAALMPFESYVGNVALSTDGFGSTSESGIISASVPAGSTVLAAYLYSATNSSSVVPTVTLDGSAVAFGPAVPNATACCNLRSYRSDVTSIVKSTIEAGPGGVYDFAVTESGLSRSQIDGEALVIVYENPALPEASVGLLDGFASVTGDSTSINFGDPLDPTDPTFFAEMSLGISFSCCNQKSTVEVNGNLLTNNAGNYDDGDQQANGSLITVGGFDDPLSGVGPNYSDDSERYDLSSFVNVGDTSISVDTANPSRDDNIFFAGFYVRGEAGFNEPPPTDPTDPPSDVPEPGTLALLGLGLAGLSFSRRKQVK